MGLIASAAEIERIEPLPGGVSSDIARVVLAGREVCVKRALPRLKVQAEWRAPVARSRFECRWYETVAGLVPGAAPRILGDDTDMGLFAMEYLDARRYVLWKDKLRAGDADVADAANVGRRLGEIHRATADDAALAERFDSDAIFRAIRLEPYLEATAAVHADRGAALRGLAATTAATRRALVHGDVSPKNILIGAAGPVFLDAECAWFGDPAFDLAFCLNHLLLKCLWVPRSAEAFLGCFDALHDAYIAQVNWEARATFEARAAHLLPGLLLARIDGKSPVEYVTREQDKDAVRRVARTLLAAPVQWLADVAHAWRRELAR